MSVWLTKRLVYALVTLLAISTIVFGLVRLTGDPVLLFLPQDASAEDVAPNSSPAPDKAPSSGFAPNMSFAPAR